MEIFVDDRLCLDVDKVLSTVRLDPEGKVRVWVKIPQAFAKNRPWPVLVSPACETCPLYLRVVFGQLC